MTALVIAWVAIIIAALTAEELRAIRHWRNGNGYLQPRKSVRP